MKKQIKDLTNEEFEEYILNTDKGVELSSKLQEVEFIDSPIELYNYAKFIINYLEQEIIIDK